MAVPFSILDLAHIGEGQSVADALQHTRATAQLAEQHGFERLWLAEHHGMRGVASAATATLLSHIGAHTQQIRLGSGGIMLPNHSPLMVAEQFGTLASLYPDRIDLGLGRAPGTDPATARALRRDLHSKVETYPDDIALLQDYLDDDSAGMDVLAIPGAGTKVPLYLLGSSLYSAQLAGKLGLPFFFASHFAPEALLDAIKIYRINFRPSAQCTQPYVGAGVMTVVADSQTEALRLYTSVQQQFGLLRRGANAPMPAPVDDIYQLLSKAEVQAIDQTLRYAAVGTPEQVQQQLQKFVAHTGIDELMLSFPIHAPAASHAAIRHVGGMSDIKAAPSWLT